MKASVTSAHSRWYTKNFAAVRCVFINDHLKKVTFMYIVHLVVCILHAIVLTILYGITYIVTHPTLDKLIDHLFMFIIKLIGL